ncbi:transposase [Micromonospora zamorensis]|uniref:transposase n=1 Tax=Micromonospora zamorensis TaxID=709883 RepID=UPI0033C6687E
MTKLNQQLDSEGPTLSVYLVAGTATPSTPATLADHLPTNRPRHYPSDTSDAEWQILAPHVPAGDGRGRPIIYPRRDVVDAIRYLDRTGCQWAWLTSAPSGVLATETATLPTNGLAAA